ncbi:DUF7123 family protein [Salinibaculum rarum]|uniref:DUF7123 family protein n=1 Tax=Salinibaculum rarum TaxID=3058903 RepID=UPI00265FEC05|nr:hypothetical protein [Salinibaculum sp. KK48]
MSSQTSTSQSQPRTSANSSSKDTNTPDTDEKLAHLRDYLLDEITDGEQYIKGKFIADDVGLSAKEIGQLLLRLQDECSTLEVEKWSYTSATTWRIARSDTGNQNQEQTIPA